MNRARASCCSSFDGVLACERELAPMGAEDVSVAWAWVGCVGLCGFGVLVFGFFFLFLADVYTELYDADRAGGRAGWHPLVSSCGEANGIGACWVCEHCTHARDLIFVKSSGSMIYLLSCTRSGEKVGQSDAVRFKSSVARHWW
jgi:hypothetical protein